MGHPRVLARTVADGRERIAGLSARGRGAWQHDWGIRLENCVCALYYTQTVSPSDSVEWQLNILSNWFVEQVRCVVHCMGMRPNTSMSASTHTLFVCYSLINWMRISVCAPPHICARFGGTLSIAMDSLHAPANAVRRSGCIQACACVQCAYAWQFRREIKINWIENLNEVNTIQSAMHRGDNSNFVLQLYCILRWCRCGLFRGHTRARIRRPA